MLHTGESGLDPFGLEDGMFNLIVLLPDHGFAFSFFFTLLAFTRRLSDKQHLEGPLALASKYVEYISESVN